MGAQNSTNSSNCFDCYGPKIISATDLKKTSLSLDKHNKHVFEVLKNEKKKSNSSKENNVKGLEMGNKLDRSSKFTQNPSVEKLEKSIKSNEGQGNNPNMEKSGFQKKLNIDDFLFIRVLMIISRI